MPYRYLHLDVFTSSRLEGNQLAVVFGAEALPSETMQAVAQEMAFSETVFVIPPGAAGQVARLRIFTPARELPMAGHPTIGSAFALVHERWIPPGRPDTSVELGVGPTRLELEWDGDRLAFAWMSQQRPAFGPVVEQAGVLAEALGLDAADITVTGLPIQSISCGVPFLLVPLGTRAAVDRAWLEAPALTRLCRETGVAEQGVFIFSLERVDADVTAYSRMFAPSLGVAEDPATGSAAGPLGCYLVAHGAVTPAQQARMVNLQGVRMRRPSRIVMSIGGSREGIESVRVGGTSVLVAEGTLYV
jgi:trans-2,3-dihydro-3-hydroxyanthranilate isomerase